MVCGLGQQFSCEVRGLSASELSRGLSTSIPLSTRYAKNDWLGVFGIKSEVSVQTVPVYLSFAFPILLLSNFPFDVEEGWLSNRIEYDEKDEFHLYVENGRGALGSAILAFCGEGYREHFAPAYDFSIFPAG